MIPNTYTRKEGFGKCGLLRQSSNKARSSAGGCKSLLTQQYKIMNLEAFMDWFMALGEPYGVNPVIFGSIYVGAVPFFWVAIAWLARNIKHKRSIVGPVLMAGGCAVSAYVYLIFVGQNVPVWVYGLIAAIIGYALYATWQKVQEKKQEALKQEAETA
jgi:hypothetical protein